MDLWEIVSLAVSGSLLVGYLGTKILKAKKCESSCKTGNGTIEWEIDIENPSPKKMREIKEQIEREVKQLGEKTKTFKKVVEKVREKVKQKPKELVEGAVAEGATAVAEALENLDLPELPHIEVPHLGLHDNIVLQ